MIIPGWLLSGVLVLAVVGAVTILVVTVMACRKGKRT